MKKLALSAFIVLLSLVTSAQEVNWVSFEDAVELTRKEPRKLLIDLYTDWCGWCKKMDKDTYTDPEVIETINKNYYAVKFNAEQKDSVRLDDYWFKFIPSGRRGYHELAAALTDGQMTYPTTVFMDEEIRIIQPIAGYMGPKEFLPIIKFIGEDHFKKISWEEYTSAN